MNKAERILTVSEVSINQVAIEIKVLKIGNRQVTLAVFQQLLSEPIIDNFTGELKGIPWGYVNYHGVGCGSYPGGWHLHIIWQNGNELRKALHYQSMENEQKYRNANADACQIDAVEHTLACSTNAYYEAYRQLGRLEQLFIAV